MIYGQLLIAISLAALPFGVLSLRRKMHWGWRKTLLGNFILAWLVVISIVYFEEWYLKFKLNSFDLDGDGFFSTREITDEQKQLMSLVVNDIGRTFAIITAIPVALVHTAALLFLLQIRSWLVKGVANK